MRTWLAVMLLGCADPATRTCADGILCPIGNVCEAGGECVVEERVAACAGASEGAACRWRVGDLASALISVWPNAADDVYAVGEAGTVLHFDGRDWSPVDAGVSEEMGAIWGWGPSDVFAGGDAVALRYDGDSWSAMEVPTPVDFQAIWGFAHDDVWMSGDGGLAFHWDGSAWEDRQTAATTDLATLWGSGPSDIYVGGDGGQVAHFDGEVWTVVDVGLTTDVEQIWGTGPGDVYVVGKIGALSHWDGAAWTPLDTGIALDFLGIGGTGPNDVFVVGEAGTIVHYDGTSFMSVASPTDARLEAVSFGRGGTVGYAVGATGTILRYQAEGWTVERGEAIGACDARGTCR
jgi:hypothetical protein